MFPHAEINETKRIEKIKRVYRSIIGLESMSILFPSDKPLLEARLQKSTAS